jgi:hypothetical protein
VTLRLKEPNLMDFLLVARLLPEDERRVFARMMGAPFDSDRAAARYFLADGMAWVFDAPERPVAVGGVIPIGDGVFRTWFMALDRAWTEHGHDMTALVRGLIDGLLDDKLARRIETVTLPERSRARRWYEKIGLKFDSTLPGYCADGADAVLYVAERG